MNKKSDNGKDENQPFIPPKGYKAIEEGSNWFYNKEKGVLYGSFITRSVRLNVSPKLNTINIKFIPLIIKKLLKYETPKDKEDFRTKISMCYNLIENDLLDTNTSEGILVTEVTFSGIIQRSVLSALEW